MLLHRYVVNDQGGPGKTLFQFDGEARGEYEMPEFGFTIIIPETLRETLDLSSRYCRVANFEFYQQGGVTEPLRKLYTVTAQDKGFEDPLSAVSEYVINGQVVHTLTLQEDRIATRPSRLLPGALGSASKDPRDWSSTMWLPDPWNTCVVLHVYEWRDEQGNITARRTELMPL